MNRGGGAAPRSAGRRLTAAFFLISGVLADYFPATAGSPHLAARPTARASVGKAAAGLYDLGEGHLLFVPASAASASGPVPLLVLLHGGGGTAASILRRFHGEAERAGIVLLAVKSKGATWDVVGRRAARGSSGSASRVGDDASDFSADVPRIDEALARTFGRLRIDPARVGLGGFSDGASYALSIGLANPGLFKAVLAFSPGMAVLRSGASSAATGGRRQQLVYVSHGRSDGALSFRYTTSRILPLLRASDAALTFRAFDGGHTIPAEISAEALNMLLAAAPAT